MTQAPVPKRNDKRIVLWVIGAFILSIVVWGSSMWLLRMNIGRTLMLLLQERERVKSLETWTRKARQYGIDYDKAMASPQAAVGKPVAWTIHIPDAENPRQSYYNEDLSRRVQWTNPDKVKPSHGSGRQGRSFPIVAIIRDVDPATKIIQLEYLGYE